MRLLFLGYFTKESTMNNEQLCFEHLTLWSIFLASLCVIFTSMLLLNIYLPLITSQTRSSPWQHRRYPQIPSISTTLSKHHYQEPSTRLLFFLSKPLPCATHLLFRTRRFQTAKKLIRTWASFFFFRKGMATTEVGLKEIRIGEGYEEREGREETSGWITVCMGRVKKTGRDGWDRGEKATKKQNRAFLLFHFATVAFSFLSFILSNSNLGSYCVLFFF